jgi:hypothetical protein
MSIAKYVYLRCDGGHGDGTCPNMHFGDNAADARREMRANGWVKRGSKDFCADHAGKKKA